MEIRCPRCGEELFIQELEVKKMPQANFQATIEVRCWKSKDGEEYCGFIYFDTNGEALISPRFRDMRSLVNDLNKVLIKGPRSVLSPNRK